MFSLEPHTIFLTLAGSHAHGTARPGSDVDLRGVCVAPLRVRVSLFDRFEQVEGPIEADLLTACLPRLRAHPSAGAHVDGTIEGVVFDIAKFLQLCAAANPNALELLFADPADWLLHRPAWSELHGQRERFLTRKAVQTFSGYATAQLRKLVAHRDWLRDPPTAPPRREDFGLPADTGAIDGGDRGRLERRIAEHQARLSVEDLELPDDVREAVQARFDAALGEVLSISPGALDDRLRAVASDRAGLSAEVSATLNAERAYRDARQRWRAYQGWAKRHRAAGPDGSGADYDTKDAMHLIRLLRMGVEIVDAGTLRVRRPDAVELGALRDGAWPFDDVVEHAEALLDQLRAAARTSELPARVDPDWLDALSLSLIRRVEDGVLGG